MDVQNHITAVFELRAGGTLRGTIPMDIGVGVDMVG